MIGIFGGTFDPVHYGHIKPALSVKQDLGLSPLLFIPNRVPPHREQPWLSVEQRLELLKLALADLPDVVIDERELRREGPSYMVDTLESLQQDYPGETLCLIIGMDAFAGITRWHRWRELFGLCHLVVTTRPGFSLDALEKNGNPADFAFLRSRIIHEDEAELAESLGDKGGQILLKSVPQLDISSTMIRHKLAQGEDISAYLPAAVARRLQSYQRDNVNDD
ncbi:MAG TPA: nicotinate-nucleotide adenylyltransferase [Gammaproteobacteria bacterium]|nr:nicotinate-nucleotide adenylyltransferase [Gammaproteobacteria bacterium]